MKYIYFVLLSVIIGGTALTAYAEMSEPLMIRNDRTGNALTIMQEGDVGPGRSDSGALVIDNSGNPNSGLTLYSDRGPDVVDPLMRLEIDNSAWDQPILHIRSDAETSHGLIRLDSSTPEIEFVETDQDNDHGEGKFEVRVQHDYFQINSRRGDNKTFENTYTFAPLREGAKFGIGGDISPDAGLEIITTGSFPAFLLSSTRDADGDIARMEQDGTLTLNNGTLNVLSGKAATFSGGINITGGCIAIDGECLDGSLLENLEEKDRETLTISPISSGVMKVVEKHPSDIECNSYDERGVFMLDAYDNTVWVCNGPVRGWDSLTLED